MTYEYDANLNQVAKEKDGVQNAYQFGIRDQILRASTDGSEVAKFDYRNDRMRVKKISGTEETRYLYDQDSVLQEYNNDAGLPTTIKYNYGYELLSLTEVTPAENGNPEVRINQFYMKDGLMSTANLTDDAGALKHSYRYDAWGRIRDQIGTSANPRQYTGHYKDEETDLHYFGARYYDDEIGRFLSQDLYLGDHDNPPSLHRYLYANNNPMVFVDPTGLFLVSVHKDIVVRAAENVVTNIMELPIQSRRNRKLSPHLFLDFKVGLKRGVSYPDIPDGYLKLLSVFDVEIMDSIMNFDPSSHIQQNPDTESNTYRSHLGDLQHWHFMVNEESDATEFQEKVINRVVKLTKESRLLVEENPVAAGVRLGMAIHTVHDSYSDAHAKRDGDGNIVHIQNYRHQDSHRHKTADDDSNKKNIAAAENVTQEIINFTITKEFDEAKYREYLKNHVFKLKGQEKGKIQVELGGTHKDFEKLNFDATEAYDPRSFWGDFIYDIVNDNNVSGSDRKSSSQTRPLTRTSNTSTSLEDL